VARVGEVDGVTFRPLALPSGLDTLAEAVLPLLRPDDGDVRLLRERLGFGRPTNHFTRTGLSA
jgi:hypothetical protein